MYPFSYVRSLAIYVQVIVVASSHSLVWTLPAHHHPAHFTSLDPYLFQG